MIYLNYINTDFKKQLETKYEVNINFKENNVILTNCSDYLLPLIQKEIKDECLKKFVKSFSTQYFPGLKYVIMKDAFKQELKNIKGI